LFKYKIGDCMYSLTNNSIFIIFETMVVFVYEHETCVPCIIKDSTNLNLRGEISRLLYLIRKEQPQLQIITGNRNFK